LIGCGIIIFWIFRNFLSRSQSMCLKNVSYDKCNISLTAVCTRERNFVASNYPKDPITWTVDGKFIVSYVKRLTWTDHESRKWSGCIYVGVGWTLLWENVTARVPLSRMWSILCDNLETSITQINTRGNFNKPYRKRRWNSVFRYGRYISRHALMRWKMIRLLRENSVLGLFISHLIL